MVYVAWGSADKDNQVDLVSIPSTHSSQLSDFLTVSGTLVTELIDNIVIAIIIDRNFQWKSSNQEGLAKINWVTTMYHTNTGQKHREPW